LAWLLLPYSFCQAWRWRRVKIGLIRRERIVGEVGGHRKRGTTTFLVMTIYSTGTKLPLVVMDDEEYEYELSMERNANHYLYTPLQESYSGKYDLSNLNTDYFTTTISSWDSVMLKRDSLPSSFVENIRSSFQKKDEKESIDEKKENMKNNENSQNKNNEGAFMDNRDSYLPAVNSYAG
jgi:hypothetical protein